MFWSAGELSLGNHCIERDELPESLRACLDVYKRQVWMFTVSAAVIGICFSFTTGVCMSDVIDQWFSKSSGLAIGLAWGVNSLCTLLLSPVITLAVSYTHLDVYKRQ